MGAAGFGAEVSRSVGSGLARALRLVCGSVGEFLPVECPLCYHRRHPWRREATLPSICRSLMAGPVQLTVLVLVSVIAALSLLPVQQALADPLADLRDAVLASDDEGVRKALSEGANINARLDKKRGRSALIGAAEKGDQELVTLLIEAGADIEFATKRGRRALHRSIYGNVDTMRVLPEAGADVNAPDKRSNRTLNLASYENFPAMVELLIGAGADVNVRNERNNTPLHHAAEKGSIDAIRLLIAAGAKLQAKNKRGRTPLKVAQDKGQEEAAKVLKLAGAN